MSIRFDFTMKDTDRVKLRAGVSDLPHGKIRDGRDSTAARLEVLLVFILAAMACWLITTRIDRELMLAAVDDIWFESDMARNFQTMVDRNFDDVWPAKHPIFALVTWPFVALIRMGGAEPLAAVQITLAINGGLFAALLMHLLRADGTAPLERIAVLALLLSSAAFWMWFSVPDTFAFGATSLLLGFTALAHDQRGTPAPWWLWVIGSAAALAITVTNFVAAVVSLVVRLALIPPDMRVFRGKWPDRLRNAMLILVAASALVMAGSVLQNQVFPGTGYAFSPQALAQEKRFVGDYESSSVMARLQTLFVAPIVMGLPAQRGVTARGPDGQLLSTLVVDGRWPTGFSGRSAAVLWVALLALGIAAVIKPTTRSPLAVAALVFFSLQVALHLVYGELAFLYVAHLLPCVLIVAARARFVIGHRAFIIVVFCLAALTLPQSLQGVDVAAATGGTMVRELLSQ